MLWRQLRPADVIISGAGLPVKLPEYIGKAKTKIAPIVSSRRAADIILKMWARRYDRTADFVVIEGPKAGGHLGFSDEELADIENIDYDEEIKDIIECTKEYGEKYNTHIPVIVAGGIFDHDDIIHALELGADGVQIASRFVATKECDASDEYKQAYLDAKEDDVKIIKSPVGMPGRAIHSSSAMPVFHALSSTNSYMNWLTPKPSSVEPTPRRLSPPWAKASSMRALTVWKLPDSLVLPPQLPR